MEALGGSPSGCLTKDDKVCFLFLNVISYLLNLQLSLFRLYHLGGFSADTRLSDHNYKYLNAFFLIYRENV